MSAPTRYFTEYVTNWKDDEAPDTRVFNTSVLAEARRVYNQHLDALPQIFERTDIRDVTPKGNPRGLLWDWDEVMIEDCP